MTLAPGRSGVLVVDKGRGVSSFQVVSLLRRVLRVRKIGHGGTLDPHATGVLPILIGEATKLTPYLVDLDKEYVTTIRLGMTTETQDVTGRVLAVVPVPSFTRDEIEHACRRLTGVLGQIPPMYSALHHGGRRLYELARAGVEVARQPREIVVHSIAVETIALPTLTLRIVCGKGTYIRTLAADLGTALGVGGAVAELCRTRVGPFDLRGAVPWSEVREDRAAALWERLRPPEAALPGCPVVVLDPRAAEAVRHGQSVDAPVRGSDGAVRLYDAERLFIGVGRVLADGRVKPERILHADHPGTRVLPA